jgi:heme/copper-type cytochrome/quinol oxidase subunit 2
VSARPLPAALAALLLAAGAASQETVEVQVSRGGFRPSVLNARAGETLRLRLTSTDGEHCFALDALRVEKRVVPGRATLLDLTPDRVGRFTFHCCLEGADSPERGTLVVGE